ncbi:MAG: hypothetical protein EHM42_14545 [Planctomycetaceae bacterium]|nr:MAG: hypothetical protein EHM42_14545 [Planctomycetaceae bacterium]
MNVDDRAETAAERAPPPHVERGEIERPPGDVHGQKRRHRSFQARQIIQVVVDRLQFAIPGVAKQSRQAPFGFTGEQHHPGVANRRDFRRQLGQHRNAAADVKSSDGNVNARSAEFGGKVGGPRKLIGLHSRHHDQPAPTPLLNAADNLRHRNDGVNFVVRVDHNLDVWPQRLARFRLLGDGAHRSQRTRRNERPRPLDHIAVVVIV